MMLPGNYPLLEDLGCPNGEYAARANWLDRTKQRQRQLGWMAISICSAWMLMLAFFGMMPWMAQRASSPQQLNQRLQSAMPFGNAHLGAEYYNIASALVEGRGFSDPFSSPSGPTAWMPPLLVWIQAALIWLFSGDRYNVMCVVVAVKTLIMVACSIAAIRRRRRASQGLIFAVVIAFVVMTEFEACFAFTHDGWIILAGIMLTLFGVIRIRDRLSNGRLGWPMVIAWGSAGGLIALSSPIAGYTWAVVTTAALALKAPKQWLAAGLVSVLVVAPWAVRNKLALGKMVPVKSNLFFEIDQSFALDDDGLLDWKTMSNHPYHTGPEQDAYIAMGELPYLETKKERFISQFNREPGAFVWRVKNRLVGMLLWPSGFSEFGVFSPTLPLRWAIYPLPIIALICLLISKTPLLPIQRWAIVIYATYSIPYILFSFYPRYSFPLLMIKALFCSWAIERLIARFQKSSMNAA